MLLELLIRKYFYFLMRLGLLQACKGHFLCFWGSCRLARVTFCAFGALAGLQGLLFVLLELLQACKGHFKVSLGLLQADNGS